MRQDAQRPIEARYAAALAAEFAKPGLDHLNLFQNMKESVLASTGGAQQPWESNGLGHRVYLTGPPAPADRPPSASIVSEAERAWVLIKDSKALSDFEAFRLQYGKANTFYRQLAEKRIEELKKEPGQAKAEAQAEAKRQRDERIVAEKKAAENAKREADEAATKKRAEKAAEAKAQAEAEAEAKRQRDESVAKEKATGFSWQGRPYVYARPWVFRPYYGTVIAGAALGTIITVPAVFAVPPRPAPNLCWYWARP